jgi:hypothetical protein
MQAVIGRGSGIEMDYVLLHYLHGTKLCCLPCVGLVLALFLVTLAKNSLIKVEFRFYFIRNQEIKHGVCVQLFEAVCFKFQCDIGKGVCGMPNSKYPRQ